MQATTSSNLEGVKYLNGYTPPKEPEIPHNIHKDTPAEEYDLNFNGGLITVLNSSKVELRPMIVSLSTEGDH